MEFVSISSFDVFDDRNFEKPTSESLTVPDETVSLRTMLEHHIRGIPLSSGVYPVEYDDDFDLSVDSRGFSSDPNVHKHDLDSVLPNPIDRVQAYDQVDYLRSKSSLNSRNNTESGDSFSSSNLSPNKEVETQANVSDAVKKERE